MKGKLLTIAVFDGNLVPERREAAAERLEFRISGTGSAGRVQIDDAFRVESSEDLDKFLVLAANHAVDVIVADRETVKAYAASGFLEDMENVLDSEEIADWKELLVFARGYRESDEISFEDTQTGMGETRAYGISLRESVEYRSMGGCGEDPVLGVLLETPHEEAAHIMIQAWVGTEEEE